MGKEIILKDKLILKYLKHRNEEAIRMILEEYGTTLKSVIWYHLRFLPVEDREECMNETLFEIWNDYSRYDAKKGSLKNWIAGVARFNAIDSLRRNQKYIQTENIDDYELQSQINLELEVMQEDVAKELEEVLAVLNEQDRDMIRKHYIDGISIKTIAETYGLKEANVYKRIERAIKKAGKNWKGES